MAQGVEKFLFILFRPTIIIVYISPIIRWVAINNVVFPCLCYCFKKVYIIENPLLPPNYTGDVFYLITYFGYICRCKSLRFLAKRYIPTTLLVETHHPIKSCTRQEYKIIWAVFSVEPVAHKTIVGVTILIRHLQKGAFTFKICTHSIRRNLSVLYLLVEIDDVRIGVANNVRAHYGAVETHHASSKEGFYPACGKANARSQYQVINPRHQFCLDTLRLYRGNDNRHLYFFNSLSRLLFSSKYSV